MAASFSTTRNKSSTTGTQSIRHLILLGLLAVIAPIAVAQPSSDRAAARKDWVYIQNDHLQVGFLRSHGGAIAHLSAADSDFNVLNHYDHGRLVQQSYYGDADESRWVDKPWRYNPVQGGDYKGNAAELVEFRSTETTTFARTIPRHWASGELLTDCVMEQQAELHGPILRVRFRFQYKGTKTHQPRHQETPAVFVAPELRTLVTYHGSRPWTNGSLSRTVPGWPNEKVALPENWAAYVGEHGNGIGVYVPGVTEATTYRFRGGSGSDCSYIAPLRTFGLTPAVDFSYTAYFTLGDVDTIRERFKELPSNTKS